MKSLHRNLRHLTNQGLTEKLTQPTILTQLNETNQVKSTPIEEPIDESTELKEMVASTEKKGGKSANKDRSNSRRRKGRSSDVDERH